jgi:hypothetical protein
VESRLRRWIRSSRKFVKYPEAKDLIVEGSDAKGNMATNLAFSTAEF